MSGRSSPSMRHGRETLPAWLAPALTQDLSSRLSKLYQRLPPTTCQRRGLCCGLLPPLAPLEMLVWLGRLLRQPGPERARAAGTLVAHFLGNAAQRLACPWARPGACADYEGRFFACRAYGLWSPRTYQARRQQAQAAQEQVARAWAGLGLDLPDQVLAPGPEYCRAVRPLPGPQVDDAVLQEIEDQLHDPGPGLEEARPLLAFGNDLSYLVAALCLGQEQCLRAKLDYTRAALKGKPQRARKVLEQAEARAGQWAGKLSRPEGRT